MKAKVSDQTEFYTMRGDFELQIPAKNRRTAINTIIEQLTKLRKKTRIHLALDVKYTTSTEPLK